MNDPVTDQILAALTVNVTEFAICEFAADSAIEIAPLDKMEVHFVLAGTLHLGLPDGASFAAPFGSVVLVPARVAQIMGGSASPARIFSPDDTCNRRRDGLRHYDAAKGGESCVTIACGQIRPEIGGSFGPFEGLRRPICVCVDDEPVVAVAFAAILRETRTVALGGKALVGSLMKTCLILALRRRARQEGAPKTLPGLFEQPSLARAVALVMDDPSAGHTLADLARAAGMSRSKFAKMFQETLGMPPIEFVTRARLTQARELLVSTRMPVAGIAGRVGFASRSHFSRAFRNAFGTDPSGMRRNRLNGESANAQ